MFVLRKQQKWRSALLVAVLYGACVLAPAVAFALADGSRIAHCFFDDNHAALASHDHGAAHGPAGAQPDVHGEASGHDHSQSPGAPAQDSGDSRCCGLMGFSALPALIDEAPAPQPRAEAARSFTPDEAASRPPEPRYRPPIVATAV